MNTFLPYPSFEESVRVLDDKRLGKQRVEVLQLVNVLTDPTKTGWRNHPATNMWRGYEKRLCEYGIACCEAWTERGYKDTVAEKLKERLANLEETEMPHWFGDPAFHAAHRSNLLKKDPDFYARYGWSEPSDLEYIWPSGRQQNAES